MKPKGYHILEVIIMKKFMDKPITWGGYLKLAGIGMVISLIISAISWFWVIHPRWYSDFIDNIKRRKER